MAKIDTDKINFILATDCGSTTTKAILIQKIDGEYRQTHRRRLKWKYKYHTLQNLLPDG